jgi:hypothetical protein
MHVLETYLNIKKLVTKSKTNREMLQHDFEFFANLMTFLSQKKKWSKKNNIIYIFTFMQNFKPKKTKCQKMNVKEWFFYN